MEVKITSLLGISTLKMVRPEKQTIEDICEEHNVLMNECGCLYDKQCHKCRSFNVLVPLISAQYTEYKCCDCGKEWYFDD